MQRTKTLSFKLVVLLLIACLVMPLLQNIAVQAVDFEDRFYGFEDGTHTGWYSPWSGQLSVTSEKAYTGSKSLKISGRQNSWDSPALNMYNIIKQGGAGVYTIHMAVLVDNLADGGEYGHLLIRGNQENSFITPRGNGNYYYKLTSTVKLVEDEWYYFTGSFIVTNADISATSGLFNLCFDFITPTANQNIYIDSVKIIQTAAHTEPLTVSPTEATLFTGDRLVLDLNRYNNLTFTSSNPTVARVYSGGVVHALSSGRTTITINYNNTETAECVVDVKNIYDGLYFIKNIRLDNYLKRNDGNRDIAEVWEFDGLYDQRWLVSYVGEGYYKIRSFVGGEALTVNANQQNNIALQLMDYNDLDTQKWRFENLENGNYKIVPKVAIDSRIDWCMAVGDSVTEGITNGRNVQYRDYSELKFKDKGQWKIVSAEIEYWNDCEENIIGYWAQSPQIYVKNNFIDEASFFDSGCESAMSQWEDALSIDFNVVNLKINADIECYGGTLQEMEELCGKEFESDVVGLTYYTYYALNNNSNKYSYEGVEKELFKMKKAIIYIPDFDYNESIQKEIIVHEFGHALGYFGHSSEPNDVMYHQGHSNYMLSDRDKQHLKQFYKYIY